MITVTEFAAGAGMLTGLIGATLGILNYWKSNLRDRVRLRAYAVVETEEKHLGVQIVNIGFIPAYIESVTIFPSPGEPLKAKPEKGESFPFLLLPRASVQCFTMSIEEAELMKIQSIRAEGETCCETKFIAPKITVKDAKRIDRRYGKNIFISLKPK